MPPPLSTPAARWLSVTGLGFIAAGVSAVAWRRPTVFPWTHPLWLSSTGLVLGMWVLVALAAYAAWRARPAVLAAVLLVPGGGLMAVGVVGRLVFPASLRVGWALPLVLGAMWSFGLFRTLRRFEGREAGLAWSGLVPGALVGALLVLARVPPPAATHPRYTSWEEAVAAAVLQGGAWSPPRAGVDPTPPADSGTSMAPPTSIPPAHSGTPHLLAAADSALALPGGPPSGESGASPTASFTDSTDGGAPVVTASCGPAHLEISATLTFQDSSRDGFWPLFSRPWPQRGRRALALRPIDGGVEVEAFTELPRAIFSHLNTFAEVRVMGPGAPALRFSATGDAVFPSTVFDYPKGRPAHFAFRTAAGDFVVARGADAEKGPFTTLARGRLSSEEALTVTVLEGERPLCDVTFFDFAAQADTSLSPTAGEGVSVNVVQFGRPAKWPGVTVLHLSLAETGIGSGLDAVGHAPGVYVNRLRVVSR